MAPAKPAEPEGPKNKIFMDDSTRKSSLVQGELADLEVMRQEGDGGGSRRKSVREVTNSFWDDVHYTVKVVGQNPRMLFVSFVVFAILCAGGLGLVFYLAQQQDNKVKSTALGLAVETGRWFCKFLKFSCSIEYL